MFCCLPASVGSSIGSPDQTSPHHMAQHSPISHSQSSHQFISTMHQQHVTSIPKSPSTGYLGMHSLSQNINHSPLQTRLSKSCEDMLAPGYNQMSAKQAMQLNTENTLADIDSIIMSPGSPMRVDNDNDDQLMAISNNIPIPNGGINKTDPLGWLDLNSPTLTTSPNASTEVTYMNRGSPPAMLYGTSSSLHNEQLNLPLFELDHTGQGNYSHDFTEAMDFCV